MKPKLNKSPWLRLSLKKLQKINVWIIVFFTDARSCHTCDKVLAELEKIDDDTDNFGVDFIKINDKRLAKKYGIKNFPALTYFREKEPIIYEGESAHLPANQLYCPLSNALFANFSLSQLSVRGIWCERASLRCTRVLKLGSCPRVQEACFTRQPTFDNKELSQTRIWLNAKTTVCGFAFFKS